MRFASLILSWTSTSNRRRSRRLLKTSPRPIRRRADGTGDVNIAAGNELTIGSETDRRTINADSYHLYRIDKLSPQQSVVIRYVSERDTDLDAYASSTCASDTVNATS